MICTYEKTIYKSQGFCIFIYVTNDKSVPQKARSSYYHDNRIRFTAVGHFLPETKSIDVELKGKWEENKHGLQYVVNYCSEIIPESKIGIIGYLSSGLIHGIGSKTAEAIVKHFGLDSLRVIEEEPNKLLNVNGISESKLLKIQQSYKQHKSIKDIVSHLAPFGITINKILTIHDKFGAAARNVVINHPYELCKIKGFGFKTVDDIARKTTSIELDAHSRIAAALFYTLEQQSQMSGHLFVDSNKLCEDVLIVLNDGFSHQVVDEGKVTQSLYRLALKSELISENGCIYLPSYYEAEKETAKKISTMLHDDGKAFDGLKIEETLVKLEKQWGINLSDNQKEAIKMCFSTSCINIITGGPGTGKTTVLKFILHLFNQIGSGNVLLVAPTGRAARKMSESTEYPSMTIHSALGLGAAWSNTQLCEDYIIVDESSMLDMYLANKLFKSIKPNARILLVGDEDQLPSVGAGNVFKELINSNEIPVTTLDTIYRQSNGSKIITNAHSINAGKTNLDYGDEFVFKTCESDIDTALSIEKYYEDAVNEVGMDQVQILSPFRKKGVTSVNAINESVQAQINPGNTNKPELHYRDIVFRLNDRVIQTKNKDEIANGEIGTIKNVHIGTDNDSHVTVEFPGSRIIQYSTDALENLDLAYAITVHKSQGSEYQIIIMPLLRNAYIMLQRNLLYTAVTRAKSKVILVGEKQALYMAIHNNKTKKRNTMLGERIKDYCNSGSNPLKKAL